MEKEIIDFDENTFFNKFPHLFDKLLLDKSTGKNIIWASKDYDKLGKGFSFYDEIKTELITHDFINIIKPRVKKDSDKKKNRSRELGEVFTPAYICNKQINYLDNIFFERENVFNKELINAWISNKKIDVSPDEFENYINDIRLEITCGEGPYVTSRYDSTSGIFIRLNERIGLLDRKIKLINQFISDENEWISKIKVAYKSVYAFDLQGDNVLLTRESLLLTFIENYYFKFNKYPTFTLVSEIIEIIVWNVFQMDGLKNTSPLDDTIESKIKDWKKNKIIKFSSLGKDD